MTHHLFIPSATPDITGLSLGSKFNKLGTLRHPKSKEATPAFSILVAPESSSVPTT